jgi:hypothetical protein
MNVPIKIRRITETKTRDGFIPRSTIETIAAEKSVVVHWESPITFEVTRAAHGRGILKFFASYQGRPMPIFQVLDAADVKSNDAN